MGDSVEFNTPRMHHDRHVVQSCTSRVADNATTPKVTQLNDLFVMLTAALFANRVWAAPTTQGSADIELDALMKGKGKDKKGKREGKGDMANTKLLLHFEVQVGEATTVRCTFWVARALRLFLHELISQKGFAIYLKINIFSFIFKIKKDKSKISLYIKKFFIVHGLFIVLLFCYVP